MTRWHFLVVPSLMLLLSGCTLAEPQRRVMIEPMPPTSETMRDCPVKDLVHDGTLPSPTQPTVLAPEDRIFDETVSDFIAAIGSYQFRAHPPNLAIGIPSEVEARALLTPNYSADLTTLEEARTPLTLDQKNPDVTFGHLETTIRGRRATQKVVYCLHQGGNSTQVFHLQHMGVG